MDKLGRKFRTFFDLLPDPTFILEYRDGDFYMTDCNFAMIGKTKTKIVKFLNTMPLSVACSHRPDLIEIIHRCRNERTFLRVTEQYTMITTGEVLFYDAHFISIDDLLVMVQAMDITENHVLRLRMARAIYNSLSIHERDVLFYMVRGLSRSEIAESKRLKTTTIYSYIDRIKEKAGGDLQLMIDFEKDRQKNSLHYVMPD